MDSRQPDNAPDGVLVLDVAPATPSSSVLSDNAPDSPDNVTLFTGQTTMCLVSNGQKLEKSTYTCRNGAGQELARCRLCAQSSEKHQTPRHVMR